MSDERRAAVLPEFPPITPERINAIFTELMRPNPGENHATKWTRSRQAVEILEQEQERVTRIHEAYYQGEQRALTATQGADDDAE